MRAGVIGTVAGEFDVVDSFAETVEVNGRERTRCLEIDRVFSLPSGEMAFSGRAAREREETVERSRIDGGQVTVESDSRTVTRHASFVGVPGEFVVADSSDGTFAFDLIGEDTETTIERTTIDLDGFLDALDDPDPWRIGFRDSGGSADSGVLHGSDLLGDRDLRPVIEEATINQLGVEYGYRDETVNLSASRSGYVELYQPAEFGSAEYLQFLVDEIVPFLD